MRTVQACSWESLATYFTCVSIDLVPRSHHHPSHIEGSAYRKTKLPQIPPIPPNPTSVALQKALFH